MATKYLVDNLSGQTIDGNLSLGDLTVNNILNNNVGYYNALLTQTGSIEGNNISNFGFSLIVGETYTIDAYVAGDDFSNIADVQSGTINQTGCVFIATGQYPANWAEGSNLISNGGIVINVIENSLGFPIEWSNDGPFPPGVYIGYNSLLGPTNNSFPKKDTYVTSQRAASFVSYPSNLINNFIGVGNFLDNDDVLFIEVFNYDIGDSVSDTLYYTPVEIRLVRDLTPIEIQCDSIPEFDFNNVSFSLYCNSVYLGSYYTNDGSSVSTISELVEKLNTNSDTNILGTFSAGGTGGVILTMTNYYKNLFCPNGGTLTFDIFSD